MFTAIEREGTFIIVDEMPKVEYMQGPGGGRGGAMLSKIRASTNCVICNE